MRLVLAGGCSRRAPGGVSSDAFAADRHDQADQRDSRDQRCRKTAPSCARSLGAGCTSRLRAITSAVVIVVTRCHQLKSRRSEGLQCGEEH
jgi:hypothetical protein